MNSDTPNFQSFELPLCTVHSALCTNYDVIIIGAGPAGLSAALWCDELGLKTLVLENNLEIGGQLLWIYNQIANHLGAEPAANGRELRDKFALQINERSFVIQTDVKITAIDFSAKQLFLETGENFSAKFLIFATGVRRRKLGVRGENEFAGRGLLESGQRAGDTVAQKNVCIVGGGDAAAENALILARVAKKIYLVHRRDRLRARAEFIEKIKHNHNIEILNETKVLELIGDEQVSAVIIQRNGFSEPFQISVDAVLLRIGVEPNTEFLRGELKLNAQGYVEINSCGETSVADIFAIGDVANPLAPTVSSAVGMGATAAKVIAARFSRSS